MSHGPPSNSSAHSHLGNAQDVAANAAWAMQAAYPGSDPGVAGYSGGFGGAAPVPGYSGGFGGAAPVPGFGGADAAAAAGYSGGFGGADAAAAAAGYSGGFGGVDPASAVAGYPGGYAGADAVAGYSGGYGGADAAAAAAGYSGAFGGAYDYSADGSLLTGDYSTTTTTGGRNREVDETNVYVARLPPTMTMDQFRELLSPYGTVTSSRLLQGDRWQTRGVKGVGFARMATADEAFRAIKGLHNMRLPGATDLLQARLAFKRFKDGAQAAAPEPPPQQAPEEVQWQNDPTSLLAMRWAAYNMARYTLGLGNPGVHVPGAASDGPSGLAGPAPAMPDPRNRAGDYQAWLARMAYYYPYRGASYAAAAAAGGSSGGYAPQQPGYGQQPSTSQQAAVVEAPAPPVSRDPRIVARQAAAAAAAAARSRAAAAAAASSSRVEGHQPQRRRISPPPRDDGGRKKLKLEEPVRERRARSTSRGMSSRPARGVDQRDIRPLEIKDKRGPAAQALEVKDKRVLAAKALEIKDKRGPAAKAVEIKDKRVLAAKALETKGKGGPAAKPVDNKVKRGAVASSKKPLPPVAVDLRNEVVIQGAATVVPLPVAQSSSSSSSSSSSEDESGSDSSSSSSSSTSSSSSSSS